MKKLTLNILALTVLGGCAAVEYPEKAMDKGSEEHRLAIAMRDHAPVTPNVFHFDTMYVPELTEEQSKLPDWYGHANATRANGIALETVLASITRNKNITVEYRPGVQRNQQVTALGKYGTIGSILNAIEANTGYQIEASGNNLVVKKYETEVFPIRTIAGEYNYSIGKRGMQQQNNKSNDSEYAKSEAVSNNGEEYSTIAGTYNPLTDFKYGVESILGCTKDTDIASTATGAATGFVEQPMVAITETRCDEGATVEVMDADNSLLVRGLPSQLDAVRSFIDRKSENMLRQARVNLTLIAVEKSALSTLDLDFDVMDAVVGSSDFGFTTTTRAVSSILGGIGTAGNATLSHASGSTLALDMLAKQGTILQKTSLRGIAFNHRIAKLTNVNKTSFIAGRELQTTANVGATTSIKQEVVESGSLLYMMPNIGDSDVVLHLSTSLSNLTRLTTKGEAGNTVESPEIGDRELNTTVRLYPGKPLFIGGFTVHDVSALLSENGVSGFSRSSKDNEVEMVMMAEVELL